MSEDQIGANMPQNEPADMKNSDNAIEVIKLTKKLEQAEADLTRVTIERDKANLVLSDDIRARKITEIMTISDYTVEDLDKYTLDQLDSTLANLKMAKRGFKPVADNATAARSKDEEMSSLFAPWRTKN